MGLADKGKACAFPLIDPQGTAQTPRWLFKSLVAFPVSAFFKRPCFEESRPAVALYNSSERFVTGINAGTNRVQHPDALTNERFRE
jgi:hypothetical protein